MPPPVLESAPVVPPSAPPQPPPVSAPAEAKESIPPEPVPPPPVEPPPVIEQESARSEILQQSPASSSTTSPVYFPAPKKSSTGLYIAIAVVAVAMLVGVIKFLSGSSTTATPALVTINSTPTGAVVTIDGTETGETPAKSVKVSVGKHSVGFKLPGYQSRSVEVSLNKGKNPDVQVTLAKAQQKKSAPNKPEATPSANSPSATMQPVKVPTAKESAKPASKPVEKPVDVQIQEAIALYDSGKVKEAAKRFKSILEVVPNNSLARFYLQKCQDAGGQ